MRDDRSEGTSTAVVAGAVGLIVILALLAPAVVAGGPPTFVQLAVVPIVAVVVGAVIRRQSGAISRAVGAVMIAVGVVGAIALGVLLWALLNGLGRPI